ncbi:uncharacterized protein MICPUCDRAFT_49242 [Micromonas pusilla CCMP1545]|mgnify:CR=1 FL=1|uniref:Predicted protein n=1 Tax=Micromonas pusilla (strain CCMP1545) TaxID=564608 RepID=C1N999_MICPC|nr:uncharacterized protein MICPUCDRAFT_49242 [Micromonas pusilla CCMP1545]EEH51487.1 predicted protein [Micromonas pusilla CCMP1545]|eukprot:XP_003064582.1 predicted protein [Micromonas pusilla CCMP1545]
MTTSFNAVDFGFRPIRPDDDVADDAPGCSSEDATAWYPLARDDDFPDDDAMDADDALFISEDETLPDATGFGARQRELETIAAAKREEETRAAHHGGPFLGSTLGELVERFRAGSWATPSDVWVEVLETLREREKTKSGEVLDPSTARHMKYRTTLIEWILEVCADLGFGPTTADLAVRYMDRVLSKVNVPKTSLQLVAMCCLEVAVKFEEIENDVPSLPKLRKCASNVYSVEIIKKMELAVLIELDWDLATIVPAHFLEAVLAVTGGGTSPHDVIGDRPWTPACVSQLRKLACYLHSICLQDSHVATNASPSLLAASIIAMARLQLNIYPVWPAELRVATGYSCDALGPVMSKILSLYKAALPAGAAVNAGPAAATNPSAPLDAVITALEEEGAVGAYAYTYGGDYEGGAIKAGESRETLTPSPTGPLDGGFFELMEDDVELERDAVFA